MYGVISKRSISTFHLMCGKLFLTCVSTLIILVTDTQNFTITNLKKPENHDCICGKLNKHTRMLCLTMFDYARSKSPSVISTTDPSNSQEFYRKNTH